MPTTKLQKFSDFRGQSFFIGLDVHKRSWSVTVRSLNPSAKFAQNYILIGIIGMIYLMPEHDSNSKQKSNHFNKLYTSL